MASSPLTDLEEEEGDPAPLASPSPHVPPPSTIFVANSSPARSSPPSSTASRQSSRTPTEPAKTRARNAAGDERDRDDESKEGHSSETESESSLTPPLPDNPAYTSVASTHPPSPKPAPSRSVPPLPEDVVMSEVASPDRQPSPEAPVQAEGEAAPSDFPSTRSSPPPPITADSNVSLDADGAQMEIEGRGRGEYDDLFSGIDMADFDDLEGELSPDRPHRKHSHQSFSSAITPNISRRVSLSNPGSPSAHYHSLPSSQENECTSSQLHRTHPTPSVPRPPPSGSHRPKPTHPLSSPHSIRSLSQQRLSSPPQNFMEIGFMTGAKRKVAAWDDAGRRAAELLEESVGTGGLEEDLLGPLRKERKLVDGAGLGPSSSRPKGQPFGRSVSTNGAGVGGSESAGRKHLARSSSFTGPDPFNDGPPASPAPPSSEEHEFVGFRKASGRSFAPPTRAALLAAAKLIEPDDIDSSVEEVFLAACSQVLAIGFDEEPGKEEGSFFDRSKEKGKEKESTTMDGPKRTPLDVVMGENGQRSMSPLATWKPLLPPVPPLTTAPLNVLPPPASASQSTQPKPSTSATPLRPATFRAPSSISRISAIASTSETPLRPSPLSRSNSEKNPHHHPTPFRTPYPTTNPSGTPGSSNPSAIAAATATPSLRRIGIGRAATPLNLKNQDRSVKKAGINNKRPKFSTPFKTGVTPRTEQVIDESGRRRTVMFGLVNEKGECVGREGMGFAKTVVDVKGKGRERIIIGSKAQEGRRRESGGGETTVGGKQVEKADCKFEKVFDLTPPLGRTSMVEAFVRPEFYSIEELRDMDIPEEIYSINPSNAAYYSFYSPQSSIVTITTSTADPPTSLDHHVAFETLQADGCIGLSGAWVENHWRWILWKLACLIRSKPALWMEGVWSWEEVIRQLKYRYEREHNQGHRSCLKRILEGDSPASASMVLCVASFGLQTAPVPEPGQRDPFPVGMKVPVLELTDGWYRIKATVDVTLARAWERGKLRVGCKIACSGVRLDGELPSDSNPTLQPIASLPSLALSGNSTSLACWDTKFGFSPRPFIASLKSLSPDGGKVPLMDIKIVKCFPIAYRDILSVGGGPGAAGAGGGGGGGGEGKTAMGSDIRSKKDEMALRDAWNDRNMTERDAIQDKLERRLEDLAALQERVQRLAGRIALDEDPNQESSAETHYDHLSSLPTSSERQAYLKSLPPSVFPHLALFLKIKREEDTLSFPKDIEVELEERNPVRMVQSFRVLFFQDWAGAKSSRREGGAGAEEGGGGGKGVRTGQLTVWDVDSWEGEDEGDGLREGRRYIVTNLQPGQIGSWTPPGKEGDVYLHAGRNSKWREVS